MSACRWINHVDVLKINDAHIAYRHRPGLGRTVVFAHSLGADQSIWDDVIAALPRGYGVLTYDLRGHGLSEGVSASIEDLAKELSQLVDALGLTDVLFCGISIGGMIGQVLCAKRPDVVRGAVFCNTAARIGTPEGWAARIDAVERRGLAGTADAIIGNWFGPDYAARTERLALHRAMLSRTEDAGYLAACLALRDADVTDHAAEITVPVRCVGGRHDKSVPVERMEAMTAAIPNASLTILEDVGHLVCLEAPLAVVEAIAAVDQPEASRREMGDVVRRAVLGDMHVDRASAGVTDLDATFQTLITEAAWGTVWASPGLAARDRSMLTLALLAATGNFEEIPMHVRATRSTGASAEDVREAFQHVAIYAGVPRANHALKLAKAVLAEMDEGGDE